LKWLLVSVEGLHKRDINVKGEMEMSKINLLVVDDEEEFLNYVVKRLEIRDFNVIGVTSGEEAIEAAKKNPIDIALVDLKMPGIDGEETLKRLKEAHEWMEVVILTGHGSIDSAFECSKSGAYSYLQKPCDMETLLDTLKEAYMKRVMNKKNIQQKKMDQILAVSSTGTALEILSKLKELDSE